MANSIKVIEVNKEQGTAMVELFGKVQELKAHIYNDNAMITGIAIKYRTGSKVWSGYFTYWFESGNINNVRGPMDHRMRRHSLSIVGFYSDFQEANKSQHVAN